MVLSPAVFHDALTLEAAQPFHLLAVGADVEPEELDILASQVWPESSRQGEGLLHLDQDAYLTGPWQLTPEAIVGLGLPPNLKYAYLISVPTLRGKPAPAWLIRQDPFWAAFTAGAPEGLELEVLHGMRRVARRLAGALRFSEGPILVPDPDSAVNLRVLSPVWLDPAATVKAVRAVQPGAQILTGSKPSDTAAIPTNRNHPTTPAPNLAGAHRNAHARTSTREVHLNTPQLRADYDPDGIRARLGLDPGEHAWLQAEAEAVDEAAMSLPPMVDAFAIQVSVGAQSQVHVVVQGETVAPAALGPHEEGFISYDVRWIAPDIATTQENRPRRSQRLERLAVIDVIESIARVIAAATQGTILDEDDFVVRL